MGKDSLEDGRFVHITFTAPANACSWDMKVKYSDGEEATWKGLNLCNTNRLTLFWDKKNEITPAVTE